MPNSSTSSGVISEPPPTPGETDDGADDKTRQGVLRDLDNLRSVGQEFGAGDSGTLSIATTHTQARYVLPPIIGEFMRCHPNVRVSLRQGSPSEVCELVLAGEADLAIATEAIAEQDELVMLPCYQWNRCVIARPDHPILKAKPLTLEAIAKYPLVTYDFAFTGRSQINKAFAARGLAPNVVLTAIDADIIKTYVAIGAGHRHRRLHGIRPGEDKTACARWTPPTCSSRRRRASASGRMPGCAATPTASSSSSRRT
jgi:hypothetical protein